MFSVTHVKSNDSNVVKCNNCSIVICEVLAFIQNKADVMVVHDLKKQKRYDAYKIFVPQPKLEMFLRDGLWPEGIKFRFIHFNRNKYDHKINHDYSDENHNEFNNEHTNKNKEWIVLTVNRSLIQWRVYESFVKQLK